MGCAACEIEMRINRTWARIDGHKEPAAHECTHQALAKCSRCGVALERPDNHDGESERCRDCNHAIYDPYTRHTPPPAIVEFCAPRPAYGTGPTERDAAYGSDPLPELVTPRPRVPHACYDANCDCAWNELGDEWPEEEKTVADRHTQDFEINER